MALCVVSVRPPSPTSDASKSASLKKRGYLGVRNRLDSPPLPPSWSWRLLIQVCLGERFITSDDKRHAPQAQTGGAQAGCRRRVDGASNILPAHEVCCTRAQPRHKAIFEVTSSHLSNCNSPLCSHSHAAAPSASGIIEKFELANSSNKGQPALSV